MARYNIDLTLDSSGMVRGLRSSTAAQDKATRSAKQHSQTMKQLNSRLKSVSRVATLAGVAFGAMFLRSSIQKAVEQERVQRVLESQLRATGHAAGFTAEQIGAYAAKLQDLTGIGDEATLQVANVLTSFKEIGGSEFQRLLAVAQDVSTVMGQDMQSAALMLAKALADPARRLSELSRSGIIFSQSQQQVIKDLVASNQLIEAQSMILDEIENQYGGAAQAARNTLGGALKALNSELGDLQEMFLLESGGGGAIRTAVEGWIRAAKSLKKNWGGVSAFFNRVIAKMLRALAKLFVGLEKLDKFFVDIANKIPGVEVAANETFPNIAEMMTLMAEGMEIKADEVEEAWLDSLTGVAVQAEITGKKIENMVDPDAVDKKAKEAMEKLKAALAAGDATRAAERDLVSGRIGIEELQEPPFDTKKAAQDLADSVNTEFGRIDWSKFGGNISEGFQAAAGGAIGSLISGIAQGQSGEAIGTAIGSTAGAIIGGVVGSAFPVIGTAIGAAIGSAIGGILGGLVGGLFDDDGKGTVARLAVDGGGASISEGSGDRLKGVVDEIDAIFDAIEDAIGGTLHLTESFDIAVKENDRFWANFYDAAGNSIGSAEFDSFEEALEFAISRVLGSAVVEAEGPMADAFKEVIGNAAEKGLQRTQEAINILAGFDERIASATGAFSLAADSQLADLKKLQKEIETMGLSAEVAAPMLEQVADAIETRLGQIRTDTLDKLFSFFEGTTKFEEERFELAKKKVELEFAVIKAQLMALDAWEEFAEIWSEALDKAIEDIEINIGNVSGIQQVEIVADQTTEQGLSFAERNRIADEAAQQAAVIRGEMTPLIEQIQDIVTEFQFFNASQKRRADQLVKALIEQGRTSVEGRLLEFVRDNEEWSGQYKEFLRQQTIADFNRMKVELQLLDAEWELLNQRRADRGDEVLPAINAWADLADLWDAALEAALENIDEAADAQQAAASGLGAAVESLIEYRNGLLTGSNSPLSISDQLALAQQRFSALLSEALAGNVEAIQGLPSAADLLLGLAGQMFGSGAEFQAIFDQIMASLDDVIGVSGFGSSISSDASHVGDQVAAVEVALKEQTEAVAGELATANESLGKIHSVLEKMESKLARQVSNDELSAAMN